MHPIFTFNIRRGRYQVCTLCNTHTETLSDIGYISVGGWCAAQATQYSLASSFTSGLTSNLASFPANKKQLAHSHTPSSSPSPLNLLPLPQLTGHSWASPTHQLEKRRAAVEGRRERESQYPAFLEPPRLFRNPYLTPALLALLSTFLYGGFS